MDKKRKNKEQNVSAKPKRAMTAYFFYLAERRPAIASEKPKLKGPQVVKAVSEEWKQLSEEAKAPFIERTEADKKRYNAEMERWRKGDKAEETPGQNPRKKQKKEKKQSSEDEKSGSEEASD